MIIIHAAGNEKIGLGNLVRSYSLAVEFKVRFKDEVILIFECSKSILKFINKKNIVINRFNTRQETIKYISKIEKQNDKGIYISDIIDINKDFENFIRSNGFNMMIHLNDENLNNFKPNIVIDGDAFKKDWNLDGVKLMQSPKFHIIKEDIVRSKPKKSWNKKIVSNILICFGGADPALYTEKFLEQLTFSDIKNDFKVILGPGFSKERVDNIQSKKLNNVEYYQNVENMHEYILQSDIVVTLGGGIAYECMCLGIASVAIGWKYLNYYVDMLDDIKVIKKISIENMVNDLKEFSNNTNLVKEIAFNGWSAIDGRGSERIADYVDAYINS